MEFDAEARRQLVLALGAVGSLIVLIVAIGMAFPGEAFTSTGALALIGAITLFVLLMGGVGIYLARMGDD